MLNNKVLSIIYDYKLNNINIASIIQNGLQSKINTPFNNNSLINTVKSFQMIIIDEIDSKYSKQKIIHSRIIQIEPSIQNGGIHDINKWNKLYPNIELMQNDNIFESCLSSKGFYGIPYSYYIELSDAYYLRKNHLLQIGINLKIYNLKKLIKILKIIKYLV